MPTPNDKIRVLMAIPNFNGGGAERITLNLAKTINKDKFDVTVFAHEKWGSLVGHVDPSIKVVFHNEKPYRRTHLPGLLLASIKHARKADLLVGANEGRASLMMLVAAVLLRKPIICWIHNNWGAFSRVVSWRQIISIHLYDLANALVACSQGVADSFTSLVRVKNLGKMRVIYNGVPADTVKGLSSQAIDPSFEHIFAGPTVLTAGRIDFQKGQEFLVEAHARLIKKGVAHNLVILGEGPLLDERKAQAAKLGVSESVFFLGFQSNPYAFMRRSTGFALSSRFEGFPLVIIEAQSCGAPIVSVDCPSGPREVLDNGKYGILVPTENPQALADGLEQILTDRTRRNRLAELSLERSEAFMLNRIVMQWEELFSKTARPLAN